MERLNVENKTVQSILHMIVNCGEQSSYPQDTKKSLIQLSKDFFSGDEKAARNYIEALLTIEVYEHVEDYCHSDNLDPKKLVYEFHSTLMGYLNTI